MEVAATIFDGSWFKFSLKLLTHKKNDCLVNLKRHYL